MSPPGSGATALSGMADWPSLCFVNQDGLDCNNSCAYVCVCAMEHGYDELGGHESESTNLPPRNDLGKHEARSHGRVSD